MSIEMRYGLFGRLKYNVTAGQLKLSKRFGTDTYDFILEGSGSGLGNSFLIGRIDDSSKDGVLEEVRLVNGQTKDFSIERKCGFFKLKRRYWFSGY